MNKLFVEKQSGSRIKALRIDKGQKYLACIDFFEQNTWNSTSFKTRHTPQHNEVAERKNLTIMDMVRCMIKAKQIPKEFGVEAVPTTVYILSRCYTKSVQEKPPEEARSRRRPSIRHLKVFGCIAYVHVPDQLVKKLDEKGENVSS